MPIVLGRLPTQMFTPSSRRFNNTHTSCLHITSILCDQHHPTVKSITCIKNTIDGGPSMWEERLWTWERWLKEMHLGLDERHKSQNIRLCHDKCATRSHIDGSCEDDWFNPFPWMYCIRIRYAQLSDNHLFMQITETDPYDNNNQTLLYQCNSICLEFNIMICLLVLTRWFYWDIIKE